ncbi:MAG: M24 family metallopeptidase C-terminal domain-containing protein, partial [Spirochaetales bacterium]|nr:M24 family metallopeptidase C-terminal domain-containing protein [Spirochaetales bacterium]
CCPYERRLIVKEMLSQSELDMVNDYHSWVREMLLPMVEDSSRAYLIKATEPL